MRARLDRLRLLMAEAQVDVLLVGSADNRRYLSGFTGSAGVLLVAANGAWLLVDFRYWQQAEQQAGDCTIVRLPPMARVETVLPDLVRGQGWRRFGVEADELTVDGFDTLVDALKDDAVTPVKTHGLVERLRQVKDEGELRSIGAAVALTDQAMDYAAGLLEPGVSEATVAWQVEAYMRTHGADGLAFPVIVAFGPNSALPHHHPGDARLQPSDPIVIDMGARVDGYCADLTRSFCLAPEGGQYADVYAVVLEAVQAAEQQLRAGMTGQAADAVARAIITGRGYGDFFGHSLGHSLGLAIHEAPTLSRLNDEPLRVGMVETVEPGIYLPDWGGIRLEDVVVLEEHGARVLTGAPK